jgi:tryptophanyl-tRNA synthetase
VEGNPVFAYLDLFDPEQGELQVLKELYRAGKVGDVAVKQRLAQKLNASLALLRARREEIAAQPERIVDSLQAGTLQARSIAQATLAEVYEKAGLTLAKEMNLMGLQKV